MERITFYSYKGGAGRSSTALNTLPYLVEALEANEKSPILVLDMDLDSAGMTYLFELDTHFQDRNQNKTVYDIKDFLRGAQVWPDIVAPVLEEHELYKKFVPVGEKLGVENKAVLFLGVDDRDRIDNNEMDGPNEERLGNLCTFCKKNNFSAVVIDSSAGEQFSAILSMKVATTVVQCMRVTWQFRIGTFNYLERLKEKNTDKEIILLPTVVPNDREIDGILQLQSTIDDVIERINVFQLENINTDFIRIEQFGINEVERFKWKEEVLYKIAKEHALEEDEDKATKRYLKLAQLIASGE